MKLHNRKDTPRRSNIDVAADGSSNVKARLLELGYSPRVILEGLRTYLEIQSNSRPIRIRVKTKRNKGHWHSDIREGKPINPDAQTGPEGEFWVFVNLNGYERDPTFWIVPDGWLRNDIFAAHQEYLNKRQGHRALNDDSTHHSITESRLAEWKDRWELLEG